MRVHRVLSVAVSTILVACGGATEPSRTGRLTLVSPRSVRVGDALSDVPDTLVFEARNANGDLIPYWRADRSTTTGWLRDIAGGGWSRRSNVIADSTGRLRLLWQTSDAPMQRLELSAFIVDRVESFSAASALLHQAVPLRADTVVSSGSDAVCFLAAGRVGCVGQGKCNTCGSPVSTERAFRAPHWLQFSAAPQSITSTVVGACALLADGNTACWDGLGPESVARNDVGHPPFVEFRGSIGRTAAGAVWKGVFGSETGSWYAFGNRTWLPIPSDSTITALLGESNSLFVCARTASNAVMCSTGRRVTPVLPDPPFRVTSMQLLRSSRDSSVVRALGGYTAPVYVAQDSVTDRVVVRTTDGSNVRFDNISSGASAWYAAPTPDSTLRSADHTERACMPFFDAGCRGGPWHSVSESGRSSLVHIGTIETGFRRICGVRDVVVCWSYIASGNNSERTPVTLDTIRLAP